MKQWTFDSVSVFFPCYNERDNLEHIYESASTVLQKIGLDYEIIFIDDGSTDATFDLINRIAADDSRVIVLHHAKNLGYGASIQSGLKSASKELVFYTDSDCQFDLNDLPSLLSLMDNYDIVSCYRLIRKDGVLRHFNSWCWNSLVNIIFHLNIKDVNCAFKIYRRCIFDKIVMQCNGASINLEILSQARRYGFSIAQVGVNHYPRIHGEPTGAKAKVIFRALFDTIKLRIKVNAAPERRCRIKANI